MTDQTLDADTRAHAVRLRPMIDRDPEGAIREARRLPRTPADNPTRLSLRAGILIDAGSRSANRSAVEEGVGDCRELHTYAPNDIGTKYNLANGLAALARLQEYKGPGWYMATDKHRREARRLLHEVAASDAPPEIKT